MLHDGESVEVYTPFSRRHYLQHDVVHKNESTGTWQRCQGIGNMHIKLGDVWTCDCRGVCGQTDPVNTDRHTRSSQYVPPIHLCD